MNTSYTAFDHKEWDAAGLKDYGDFSDCIEFINCEEDGCDCSRGGWFYADDEALTIYFGTFGNYNSPGADSYTHAEVYETDEADDFRAEVARWPAFPEHLEREEEEEEEEAAAE